MPESQYYTPTKSEKDKKTRNRNITFFNTKFFVNLTNDEEKLRRDVVKHPELREYRKGGTRRNNVLPVWTAFSYYCAHHSMVVGMTSSVVIPDNRDSTDVLPDNTNLYSRLYALKKILLQQDSEVK